MGRVGDAIVIGVSLWVLTPATTRACECIGAGTACTAASRADAVFVGRVTAVSSRVEFEVERAVSQIAAGPVTLENGPGDCAAPFTIGQRYVVYAYRNRTSGALTTSSCTRTRPMSDPHTRGDLAYFDRLRQLDSPGALLTGVVSDITQDLSATTYGVARPLAGIELLASPVDGWFSLRTRSRADGSYEFPRVPVGRVRIMSNFPAGFEPERAPIVAIGQTSRCAEVDVYAHVDGRIRGQLLDEIGQPARGLDVQLADAARVRAQGQNFPRTLGAVSDEQGVFEFRAVGPGRYVVGVGLLTPPRPGKQDRRRYFNSTNDPAAATVLEIGAAEHRDLGAFNLAALPADRVVTVVVSAPNGQLPGNVALFLTGATRESIDQTISPITLRLPFGASYILEAVPPRGYRITPPQQVKIDRDDADRTIEFRAER